MSMIIKDKIKALKKGYPTISDKYNVAGGIVAADGADVVVGELVKHSSVPGYYEHGANATAISEIQGLALAVNVKLNPIWPNDGSTPLKYKAGEAFDLFVDGFIAIQLDAMVETVTQAAIAAVAAKTTDVEIVPGKAYYTRASNSAGKGYLNDGTYKYTLVAEPIVDNIANYYEVSVIGQDATTNQITPNKQAAIILATGGITTVDDASAGTIVAWPGAYFTGFFEGRLAELELRRL